MAWPTLRRELDAWGANGRCATLWWRDDDAIADTPPLRRLLDLARDHGTPIALAVIPATADGAIARALQADDRVSLIQHGWRHVNHAPAGARKTEFAAARPVAEMVAELAAGHARLATLFPGRHRAVLVPPWNRLAETLPDRLAGIGLRALSRHGARAQRWLAPQLQQVNTHLDPIAWRGDRGFIGEPAAIDLLVGHLQARRGGRADVDEPTGLLTHHLVQDTAGWHFVERLLTESRAHPAVRWIDLDESLKLSMP